MTSFLGGLGHLLAGFGLVLRVGSIRKWAIIPILLNTLLLVALVVLVVLYADDAVRWLLGTPASTGGKIAYYSALVAAYIGGVIVAVVLVNLLSNVVAAPFYTKLAEATLQHLTGRSVSQEGSFFVLALVTIYQELVKLVFFVGIQVFLLAFHFIPVVGSIVSLAVSFLLLAFEFTDYSLEAYGLKVSKRWEFVLAHKAPMLGFGSGAFLLTLIPLANLFVAPAAVAGGARMVVALRGENVR